MEGEGGKGGTVSGGQTRREGRSLKDFGFSNSLKSSNISFGANRKRKKSKDQNSYIHLELINPTAVSDRVANRGKRRTNQILKLAKYAPP